MFDIKDFVKAMAKEYKETNVAWGIEGTHNKFENYKSKDLEIHEVWIHDWVTSNVVPVYITQQKREGRRLINVRVPFFRDFERILKGPKDDKYLAEAIYALANFVANPAGILKVEALPERETWISEMQEVNEDETPYFLGSAFHGDAVDNQFVESHIRFSLFTALSHLSAEIMWRSR